MSDTISFKISVPTDNDGFILLQCSYCGSFFKITSSDCKDDSILNIYCPCCGLISDNYFTQDIIELAKTKEQNAVMDMIYNSFKKMERKNSSKSIIQFKAGKKPNHKHENDIYSNIDALRLTYYPCCHRYAKINQLLKMSASCCPFCGVKYFGDE